MERSISTDKLSLLTNVANSFVASGAMKDMKKIKINLSWTAFVDEDGEQTIVPDVEIELERMP